MQRATLRHLLFVPISHWYDLHLWPSLNLRAVNDYTLKLYECFSLPAGFQIKPLQPHLSTTIVSHWRYSCRGAEKYLMNLIRISDGFGVFEKSTGNLCSWVLINEYGIYGVLHTVDEYQRKKLASQVVTHMAIHRAKKGFDSITNVTLKNYASENLFYSLGFEKIHNVRWVQFKN